MKKKILFMVINMNVGGTEKALLTMLDEIDSKKYDVTLLMLEKYGGLLKDIPNWINVKYVDGYNEMKQIINTPLHINSLRLFKEGKIIKSIAMIYLYILSKIKKDRTCVFRYLLKKSPHIEEEYDLAVAYAGPMDFISYFVLHKINASSKVQWIHFDITQIGFNEKFSEKIYKNFDKIFVVSKEGMDKLIQKIPSLKDKIDVFYNIISCKNISNKATKCEGFKDDFNGVRILTVGRLALEKGQDLTIPVLARLKDDGYSVKWYCIGEGNARKIYEEAIHKYKIENDYILMGSKSNPYSFIKQCDIYVQPSRYEGYCTTTIEAKCFKKPIIATKVNGMNEQITDGVNGILVDISTEDIYIAVRKLLDDEKLKLNLQCNGNENIDTTNQINKLYKIVE